ncbi:MAG: ATP-binding cassette domain-containing protein [Alphaproteobacteria bacterium]|nr:MAG: ATP-binding cassette domain-containing protein [Alphaproteobacteria bacterium]
MLTLKNVKLSIDGKTILKDVSFDVEPGTICMLVGPNGAGKSTLFNAIAGQLTLDKGNIILSEHSERRISLRQTQKDPSASPQDDVDLNTFSEQVRSQYIGRVFQDPKSGTIADFSIWENFTLAFNQFKKHWWNYAYDTHQKEEFTKIIKNYLGKSMNLDQKMQLLSGGQRQILNLIMTTLVHSPILLLDEHTAALDAQTSTFAMELTQKLVRERNLCCLMISHNTEFIKKYGDQIIELKDGVTRKIDANLVN